METCFFVFLHCEGLDNMEKNKEKCEACAEI